MPRIPTYEQQTRATGPLGAGPVSTAVAGGQLANAALEAAQKIEISKNAWQVADATAKSLGELEQYKGELEADDDFDTHSAKYVAKAKEIEQRYTQAFGGTPSGRVWRDDFRRVAQSGSLEVAARAQVLKAQKVRADLGNTLFDQSQLIGVNPAMDEALRSQARLAVDASAAAGNLTPAERVGLLNKFDTDASEALIRRDMLADPEGAEVKLATGAYPRLSGEAQALWAQRLADRSYTVQQRRLAEENHAIALSDKAKKEQSDTAAKEGDSLLAAGNLTPAWVTGHQSTLDPGDYRYFLRALSGASDAPRNPGIYVDLRDRAGRGFDVRDDARAALRNGQIDLPSYDRIISEVEGSRPGWYKRGTQYIGTMSGVSELNPDPAAAQTKATMLDQWSDWAAEHPKASEVEAQRAYQDIVSHNMLVQQAGLPMPRFIVGSRFAPDLAATAKATVEARQKGEIDEAEYGRQAALIQRWRAALAPATPTTPKKGP